MSSSAAPQHYAAAVVSAAAASPSSRSPSKAVITPAPEVTPQRTLEDEWFDCQQRSTSIIIHLLKQERDLKAKLQAYEAYCSTLETEIESLAKQLNQVIGKQQQQQQHSRTDSGSSGGDSFWNLPSLVASRRTSTDSNFSMLSKLSSTHGSDEGAREKSSSPAVATDIKRESTPQIDPKVSMSKQNPPPCNSFYLIGHCAVPRCKFSHAYKLTKAQLDEMRRGARFHRCNALKNGGKCLDPQCVYGHHCSRRTACSRTNCAFTDLEHLTIPDNNVSQFKDPALEAQIDRLKGQSTPF